VEITEYFEPRTHVIIENFLTAEEQEQIWNEIKENESEFKAGLYMGEKGEGIYEKTKKNLGFNVTKTYKSMPDSFIRSMFYFKIFNNSDLMKKFEEMKNPFYYLLKYTHNDYTKVSAYTEGDYYDWHVDSSERGLITILYMICKEPQKFNGGDFQLKWNNEVKTIPFKNNTILIFPRNTLHKVTEIKLNSDNFYDRRFTVQCFANFII